jgi:hypothetical protein
MYCASLAGWYNRLGQIKCLHILGRSTLKMDAFSSLKHCTGLREMVSKKTHSKFYLVSEMQYFDKHSFIAQPLGAKDTSQK